ncbi:MAG: type II secretion system protein [Bacilli bacterium]|nr:type II secretion system protein [Bacilli bacterium]
MNKAFTLVELLGAIVILGIIGMITTPVIQNTIDKNNIKLCEQQIESFKKAAKNYVGSNPFTNLKETTSITIGELIEKGYIEDSELKNPKGDSSNPNFSKNSKVIIKYDGTKISCEYSKAEDEKACGD